MKVILFCAIILYYLIIAVVINGDNILPKNALEEQVLGVFDKWRKGGVHTNVFPLPSLKSIYINSIQSYYEGKGIKVAFSIGDMELTELNNFTIESLNVVQTVDNLDIHAKFAIPTLTLHADKYELHGRAYYVYPLNGSGAMTIVLRNTYVTLNIRFANHNISTSIQDFSLQYTIGKVEADLENSSWPLTKVLNSEGIQMLKNFHDEVNKALTDYVVPYTNQYLANVTTKQFLDIISDVSLNSYVIDENVNKP
ncbi:unnamed protein product, partial [Brenthis ino]